MSLFRRESITQKLGESFRRIFVERGTEFLEKLKANGPNVVDESSSGNSEEDEPLNDNVTSKGTDHIMNPEELLQMRKDMLPQLQYANPEFLRHN
jgi:mediator of RNA polymerase II transcription subunit 17